MSDVKYFNFPIQLLSGLFENKTKVLNNICEYALYAHSLKLELGYEQYELFIAAARFYEVSVPGNDVEKRRQFNNGESLYEEFSKGSPKTGLNISIFWDFYKNPKSDFDLACLAAFLAIRSILGEKPCCKVTNLYLWSRMDGKPTQVSGMLELSCWVAEYANEYQTKKIKNALFDAWGLKTYSNHTRGFYVSFDMTQEALITLAEKKKKSYRDKQRKAEEKRLRTKVLSKIYADIS